LRPVYVARNLYRRHQIRSSHRCNRSGFCDRPRGLGWRKRWLLGYGRLRSEFVTRYRGRQIRARELLNLLGLPDDRYRRRLNLLLGSEWYRFQRLRLHHCWLQFRWLQFGRRLTNHGLFNRGLFNHRLLNNRYGLGNTDRKDALRFNRHRP
jgi:hypothetical protein